MKIFVSGAKTAKCVYGRSLSLCFSCSQLYMISKSDSMSRYKLNSRDLSSIKCDVINLSKWKTLHHYMLREVKICAMQKRFANFNPSASDYMLYSSAMGDQTMFGPDLKFRRMYVEYFLVGNLMEIDRSNKIYKLYTETDIPLNEDKFLLDMRADLNKVNKKESIKLTRERALNQRLAQFNLQIRSDSELCRRYIQSGKGHLDNIVNMTVVMNFLFNKTKYKQLLDNDYKSWDQRCYGRYYLDDESREEFKTKAINLYIKEHPNDHNIPQPVLNYR